MKLNNLALLGLIGGAFALPAPDGGCPEPTIFATPRVYNLETSTHTQTVTHEVSHWQVMTATRTFKAGTASTNTKPVPKNPKSSSTVTATPKRTWTPTFTPAATFSPAVTSGAVASGAAASGLQKRDQCETVKTLSAITVGDSTIITTTTTHITNFVFYGPVVTVDPPVAPHTSSAGRHPLSAKNRPSGRPTGRPTGWPTGRPNWATGWNAPSPKPSTSSNKPFF